MFSAILKRCDDITTLENSLTLVKGLLKSKDSLSEFGFSGDASGYKLRGTGQQVRVISKTKVDLDFFMKLF